MPLTIRVGTSGYDYAEWKGSFYPADLPAARRLAYYTERFDTVEINATFYRMPAPKTVAGWAAAAPDGFAYALKAPQRITHHARLRDVGEPLGYFAAAARGLGGRLGAVLFQLPPYLARARDRLAALLALLPAGVRAAFEFRHPSWFDDEVYELLRARNAALCVADTEAGTTPVVATADWGYVRLRGGDYSDADLERWLGTIRGLGPAWRDVFVFFKHDADAPRLAAAFRDRTRATA